MIKLSVKASKASDAAKNKKVAAMKAKRSASKAVGRAMGLQRSGNTKDSGKAAYSTKTKKWSMK
jgi:hypothetical protein